MHSHTSVESSARTLSALERATRMQATIDVRSSVEKVHRSNAAAASAAPSSVSTSAEMPATSNTARQTRDARPRPGAFRSTVRL